MRKKKNTKMSKFHGTTDSCMFKSLALILYLSYKCSHFVIRIPFVSNEKVDENLSTHDTFFKLLNDVFHTKSCSKILY